MDNSLKYQTDTALKDIQTMKNELAKISGNFHVLWHNSSLNSLKEFNLFETVTSGLRDE
jgi:hypothetical protein